MTEPVKKTLRLLLGGVLLVAGYLVMREMAYVTRAGEVILSPGAHARFMPVFVLILCACLRLLSTVVVPGLLVARLWWIWSQPRPKTLSTREAKV